MLTLEAIEANEVKETHKRRIIINIPTAYQIHDSITKYMVSSMTKGRL
jgi:hypothetical protein